VAPVIFITVVLGIAGAAEYQEGRRVCIKSLLTLKPSQRSPWFWVCWQCNLLRPGSGFNVDPAALDSKPLRATSARRNPRMSPSSCCTYIPKSFADAFTGSGDLSRWLLVAVLFGLFALAVCGRRRQSVVGFLESLSAVSLEWSPDHAPGPLGAGAAMAFNDRQVRCRQPRPLLKLLGTFYLACGCLSAAFWRRIARLRVSASSTCFVICARSCCWSWARSSSESALVPLMQKLERLGCSRSVVGLVVPGGYSFNLDGTNIYLTIAGLS